MYAVDSNGRVVADSPEDWDEERAAFERFLSEIEPDPEFPAILALIIMAEDLPEPIIGI